MKSSKDIHPMEPLIADYLNGHLSLDNIKNVETALRRDETLRDQLTFERQLQQALREGEPEIERVRPQFSQVTHRLRTKPAFMEWLNWSTWGIPTAAVMLLAFLFLGQKPAELGVIEYELLTDPVPEFTQPFLRLVAHHGTQAEVLDALVTEYGLNVIDQHKGSYAIDVTIADGHSIDQVHERLSRDSRVRFVQRLGE